MPNASPELRTLPDRTPVIVAARRLPTAKAGGAYKELRAHQLAAPVLAAVLADSGLAAADVDDVILGNATGGGGNVARLAALTAGLGDRVPGLTVDRQCGSGLEAIVLACRLVQAGAGDTYVAGGVESISTAPARAHRRADGSLDFFDRAQFAPLESGDPDAGVAAENVAGHFGIGRERQDAYALESHRRANAADTAGRFSKELLPLAGLIADEGLHRHLTPALMARFPAAFVDGGTVTAGNSCPYSDGAAAVVVTTAARARSLAAEGLAFVDSAVAGTDPNLLGVGAAHSTLALMKRTGQDAAALNSGLIEFNEAFAAQVLATADLAGLDPDAFNLDGGALALGHPYGASGAVSVVRLFAQSAARTEPGLGALAMISMAGGMGITAQFRWSLL
ncbi:acetyl-CoA acetyltransferase [Arthrobacter sp. ERGS1:01]|uniref:thiolase family protein n=1 Tax=Arthrobacter sp. ERGS1:01 TaxID=1704044 RepID=UPI0006B46152|nr:thiolase family protein [Arthrobacter sp. ERGS1:01]ALE05945.1 acetyl-CoA acetyltransferase [Arthrobacter sp. ERGS1:01]